MATPYPLKVRLCCSLVSSETVVSCCISVLPQARWVAPLAAVRRPPAPVSVPQGTPPAYRRVCFWGRKAACHRAFPQLKRLGDLRHIEVRKRKIGHIVLVLHIGVQVCEAGDFGLQNQRLNLPVNGEIPTCPCTVEVCLAQPFNLYLADELADPLSGVWFFGCKPNAGRWLRQHDLGQMPVTGTQPVPCLEAKHDWILPLAPFGDRRVKLRQLLQTSQLVNQEPDTLLPLRRLIQQAQYQPVYP